MATTHAPDRRNPTEAVPVGADDVCPDTQMGDGLFRTNLCARPALVCSAIACQTVVTDVPAPVLTHKASGGIGAVDFEPLIAVGVLGDTKVMSIQLRNTSSSS